MSDITAPPIPSSEIRHGIDPARPDPAKGSLSVPPDDGETPKSGRGLLKVPSRSSSQQGNQPSATSTALSGATATDHRNSIGGRSKESEGSYAGRQRNGSLASRRSGPDRAQANPRRSFGSTTPSRSQQRKTRKRAGRFFSIFGCCGVPDATNNLEEDNENVHKLEKLPERPVTAKLRSEGLSEHPPTKLPTEKDSPKDAIISDAENSQPSASNQNQTPGPDMPKEEAAPGQQQQQQPPPPALTVDPPLTEAPEEASENGAGSLEKNDVAMPDVISHEAPDAPVESDPVDLDQRPTSPSRPPLGSGSALVAPLPLVEDGPAAEESQKSLLPPIAPEHKGRKCLVLDLDETLVHSSFKVSPCLFLCFLSQQR